jgi:hypothetical protein
MSRRVGLRHTQSTRGKKRLVNPAFSYDNLVGAIWMEDPGHSGYDNREWGETIPIEVRDPSGIGALGEIQGGYYDNRLVL